MWSRWVEQFGLNTPYIVVTFSAAVFAALFVFFYEYYFISLRTLFVFSIVWLPLYLLWFVIMYWADFVQAQARAKFEYVLLELKFPASIEQTPEAMELFLVTLSHAGREAGPYQRYIKGSTRPQWSLELASFDGQIHFFIRCESSLSETIKTRITGFYPGIEVVEVPDYTKENAFDFDTMNLTGLEFKYAAEPHAYPIPTYEDFENSGTADPITHILSVLASAKPGHNMWLQLILRANKPTQKRGWFDVYDKFKTEGEAEIHKIIDKYALNPGEPARANLMSPLEKKQVHAMERSLAKDCFEVGIRGIYFANKDDYTDEVWGPLFAIFQPFSDGQLNALRGTRWFFSKYPLPWSDIGSFFKNRDKKKLFRLYQERAYFYLPYKQKPNFMTVDEIATIFHPPHNIHQYVGVASSGPKKGPPPHNLPI